MKRFRTNGREAIATGSLGHACKAVMHRCLHDAARRLCPEPLSQKLLFFKELCRAPRTVGALCPSSRFLAQCMARCLTGDEGLVVEVGAGTGTVTRALAQALPQAHKRLWAVEQSRELASLLSAQLPAVNVVRGDARELAHLLPLHRKVDTIVSCLPLRSLAAEDVEAITQQWRAVLAPQGVVVQFTYALQDANRLECYGFYEESHSTVWRNFPPARVQVLRPAR